MSGDGEGMMEGVSEGQSDQENTWKAPDFIFRFIRFILMEAAFFAVSYDQPGLYRFFAQRRAED